MLAYIDAATGSMIAAAAAGGIAGIRVVARQALTGRRKRAGVDTAAGGRRREVDPTR